MIKIRQINLVMDVINLDPDHHPPHRTNQAGVTTSNKVSDLPFKVSEFGKKISTCFSHLHIPWLKLLGLIQGISHLLQSFNIRADLTFSFLHIGQSRSYLVHSRDGLVHSSNELNHLNHLTWNDIVISILCIEGSGFPTCWGLENEIFQPPAGQH